MTGARYPIICGPMFLVSDVDLVVAACKAGVVGGAPSLNWRSTDLFRKAIREIKSRTDQPFAINLIVNQANTRQSADLQVCVEEKVPIVITSLGSPREVIRQMHAIGSKVLCDVTTLGYGLKVQELGADGVIAVSAGAGGHAGPISPLVLIPYLKRHLKIPVIAAGGIARGEQVLAALTLGASAVQIGTRFIASSEAKVDVGYKKAIVDSDPEDIVLTLKISGTPASVINTAYVKKQGLELNWIEKKLLAHPKTKKYFKMLRSYIGSKALENAVGGTTWKEVWSAGQGVGLIDDVQPIERIVQALVDETVTAYRSLAGPQP